MVKNLPPNAEDMRVRFLGLEDTLEEGMAMHFAIAWRIPQGQRRLVGYSP